MAYLIPVSRTAWFGDETVFAPCSLGVGLRFKLLILAVPAFYLNRNLIAEHP